MVMFIFQTVAPDSFCSDALIIAQYTLYTKLRDSLGEALECVYLCGSTDDEHRRKRILQTGRRMRAVPALG